MRGQPASRMSSSRSSSRSASSAAWSCSRQRLRNARLVDQSVSSKARRAASIARCMSAFDASATSPSTSSVAGLMLVNVPASPSTSLPSISILDSKRTLGVSAMLLALFGRGVVDGNSRWARRSRRAPWRGRCIARRIDMMEESARQEAAGEQQHAGVEAHRMPGERRSLVENPGERPRETFGRAARRTANPPVRWIPALCAAYGPLWSPYSMVCSVRMSVLKVPDTRMVTPMPNGATSSARASAHRSSAPLEAE